MLAILCSGQGDQRADLFIRVRRSAVATAVLNQAIQEQWVEDAVAAWLTADSPDPSLIHEDRYAQPLLCLYQLAVWSAVSPHLGRVSLFAGLSLGELSAAGCAGALDGRMTVQLAAKRAHFMDAAAPPGRLVAVLGLDAAAIAAVCAETNAAVAIQTGSNHWTLGCLASQADQVARAAQGYGASLAKILSVTVASHTHWMEPAVKPFQEALESADWKRPQAPVLSGTTAQRLWTPAQFITSLCAQLHRHLRWDLCAEAALSSGVRTFLELGPGTMLSRTLLARDGTLAARSVDEFSSLEEAAGWASRQG